MNSNTISHSIGVDGTITFVNNVDKHFNVSLSGLETNILGAGLGYLYTAVPGIFYFYEFKNRHIAWQVYDFIKNLFK